MTEAATEHVEENTPQESEAEVKARRLGWLPKGEFRGDPDRWRPAEEYLARGETIMPLLQRDNDRLHGRISNLEKEIKETREVAGELRDFASKAEERAYERAKREIQAKIEAAAANADPNTVRTEMANLDQLEKDHKVAPKEKTNGATPAIDPEIQGWINTESWYTKDRTLNAFATDTYGELERAKPGMSTAERLAETKRLTQEKFPEKFGLGDNPKRTAAAAVSNPNGAVKTKKTGKTYEDLPDDAKRACDRFVKMIPGFKREDYLKDYDWGE